MKHTKVALFLLSSLLLLSGCIPVAVVAGATAGGAIVYDNRSLSQMNTDNSIIQKAMNRLNANAALKEKCHLSVSAYNGIVLLVGQTPTPELRETAYNLIKDVPGIARIYNEISIAGPTSFIQRTNDSWITTKIKSAMLAQTGLHSTEIKVVTEDGIVYLMGRITHRQAKLATNVARRVSGVEKVVKVFEYPH
jgi:osmotically-inducible protein OsmY